MMCVPWIYRCSERDTSENVKEALLSFFCLAGKSAVIAVLAFMANGTITNEMLKDDNLMAYDNCRMLIMRGPPRKVNITMPAETRNTDAMKSHMPYSACLHTICKLNSTKIV
ncbi:hypothetical protein Salat_0336900 [Sesamum alatum]|uniref:Uncharacterized protein n=1 Tax=Sesamum alatum TaxID=300844 RepID=A0AAE1Z0F1_9LAMI|nr:hypothetical protein Salat_0336900 [Sesamum alatum]